MAGFFIMLFGWMYVIVRLMTDYDDNKKFEKEVAEGKKKEEKERSEWVAAVTDRDMEQRVYKEIHEANEDSEIMKEIEGIIDRIPWFTIDIHEVWLLREGRDEMFFLSRIVLANRGIVAYEDAVSGGVYRTNIYRLNDPGHTGQEYTTRLFIWIHEELKKRGIYVRPVLKPADYRSFEYTVATENNIYTNRSVLWEPMIPYYCKLKEH